MAKELAEVGVLSPGGNIDAYIRSVNNIPVLSKEQEQALARRLIEDGDLEAARQLVMAHLRFVVYVAKSYSGYGLQEADLIQEGNIGLMKAVRRFNPEYGVRLVSFAVHWVKAEIHEFILRNWRIVKIATTKPQRKLFFNLRGAKKRLGWMNETEVQDLAEKLGVPPAEVRQMETRLSAQDAPFDAGEEDDEDSTFAPAQYLHDSSADPAGIAEADDLLKKQSDDFARAFASLDERAREIIEQRWLAERKATLNELAEHFGISAERIRQLEEKALKSLRLLMEPAPTAK